MHIYYPEDNRDRQFHHKRRGSRKGRRAVEYPRIIFDFQLFLLLETLVLDQEDQPKELEADEDFIEEQNQIARLVHLINNEDVDSHFRVGV